MSEIHLNVGTIGHVDHGVTTLVAALEKTHTVVLCGNPIALNISVDHISDIEGYESIPTDDFGKRGKKGKRLKNWQQQSPSTNSYVPRE